ncbi:MAG: UPF0182 family protein [Caldisericia bacterium]|jgi:uncharacterized membrane protein (UPF0182 family)|nr:UPF0182 family protein [Caldisericia bacterium]
MGQLIVILLFLAFILYVLSKSKSKIKPQIVIIIFIPFIVLVLLNLLSGIFVDYFFFDSLNYKSVFLIRFFTNLVANSVIFLTTFIILYFITRFEYILTPFEPPERKREKVIFKIIHFILILISCVTFTAILNFNYNNLLLFLNKIPTQIKTEILNKDLSFYLFTLPFLNDLSNITIAILFFVLLFSFIFFLILSKLKYVLSIKLKEDDIKRKLLKIFSFIIFGIAFKTYLAIFNFMFSKRGAVYGIGYTDYYIRIPIYYVLIVVLVILGSLLFFYYSKIYYRKRKTLVVLISFLLITILFLYSILPSIYQRFVVNPNEFSKESTFLEYNIKYTRKAYGIENFNFVEISKVTNVTKEIIEKNQTVINSARIWDPRALKDTYKEIQGIRPYYKFNDVDIDRYIINGSLREVMVSARELDKDLLPSDSRSWVNLHLKFTHGYGVCLSAVDESTPEGLPILLIKDIPPKVEVEGIKITRPEIYFGELTNDYIFVNTSTEEFDYPKGNENVYTKYKAYGGVKIDNFLRKTIFAMYFKDINILLSKYLTQGSKILYFRNVIERVDKIAPFLLYGYDPYIVINDNGELYWIGDGFTISNNFPYSERLRYGDIPLNYIRNSVKFTVNAYTGDVNFYVVDELDPIINVYRKIYKDLFKPMSEMPDDLKKHLRYPDDLVEIQSYILRDYHMKDVQVFYNREDRWDKAKEKYIQNIQEIIPYFIFMNIDGNVEFVNILPMTPVGKSNLISLFVGRCDGENYGKVIVYQFSKETLIYGPQQIEARVDQDEEISKTLTLWNQQGSQVIRGNTLLLLIDNSILYIEPVYLQATQGKIPQLKKVICATLDRLTWGDTVLDALSELFKYEKGVEKETNLLELLKNLKEAFENYKKYSGEGNFELAGKELKKIDEILKVLEEIKP